MANSETNWRKSRLDFSNFERYATSKSLKSFHMQSATRFCSSNIQSKAFLEMNAARDFLFTIAD
jgi:hypothetical protein